MFRPETEDMLPRMAPKPSGDIKSVASEGIVRPQVPEISILFGNHNPSSQPQICHSSQQNSNFPQQTYAAWKKQMLPKVVYAQPANTAVAQVQEKCVMNEYNCTGTNLYPMRSSCHPTSNMAINSNTDNLVSSGGVSSQLTYRRSLESCNNNAIHQIQNLQTTSHPFTTPQLPINHLPNTLPKSVLSICAGTQTDAILEPSNNNFWHTQSEYLPTFASKKDVDNIKEILEELKIEQQRMLKLLEMIVIGNQQMAAKTQLQDIGVQANFMEIDSDSNAKSNIAAVLKQQPDDKNKFLQHLKPTNILTTCKNKPSAQSATYRPQYNHLKRDVIEPVPNKCLVRPRSASDTSLAMNELALKYLPNEKLGELLKELNMDCPVVEVGAKIPAVPDKVNADKFEKSGSDISNASYKYLKKYRLLPEDHEDNRCIIMGRTALENDNESQLHSNSPLYNDVSNPPTNQRQAPKCSPYAGRLPLSPLARVPSPQSATPQIVVNLDNIKNQPKFL